jgi:hypothetical protein
MNGNHNQPAGPELEPSHIYHFKGKVARCSGFTGAGADGKGERILFGTKTTDFGIMDGEYWAARAPQAGTFTHIWLTLFRGQFGPQNQVHDFHPPIGDAGLYWVVPVPAGALLWSDGGRSATIEMQDVPVIDQPKWPAHGADASPARLSFKMIFEATDNAIDYNDKAKRFRVTGFLATCRMEARVAVPSIGLSWKSEPIDKCPPAAFAVIGDEVNGKYYEDAGAK